MFYLIMGAKLVLVAIKVNYAQRDKKKKKKKENHDERDVPFYRLIETKPEKPELYYHPDGIVACNSCLFHI